MSNPADPTSEIGQAKKELIAVVDPAQGVTAQRVLMQIDAYAPPRTPPAVTRPERQQLTRQAGQP